MIHISLIVLCALLAVSSSSAQKFRNYLSMYSSLPMPVYPTLYRSGFYGQLYPLSYNNDYYYPLNNYMSYNNYPYSSSYNNYDLPINNHNPFHIPGSNISLGHGPVVFPGPYKSDEPVLVPGRKHRSNPSIPHNPGPVNLPIPHMNIGRRSPSFKSIADPFITPAPIITSKRSDPNQPGPILPDVDEVGTSIGIVKTISRNLPYGVSIPASYPSALIYRKFPKDFEQPMYSTVACC